MSDELQELDGVGPARAEELADAGFETIAAVAAASAETIADETSISEGTAESLVDDAESQAGTETVDAEINVDDEVLDEELLEEDDVIEEVDEQESEPEPEVRVDLTDDEQVATHILHVVLEEATSQMQSSNSIMRDNAYDVATQLIDQLSGDRNAYRVSCTQGEMNALYRALSHGEQDYASRAGIPGMYGTFREINERVNDARTNF